MATLPVSIDKLTELVNAKAVENADDILITKHCELRMDERGINRREVWTCLRRGCVCSEPTFDTDKGSWTFKFQEPAPRNIICVVVAVQFDESGEALFVLTAYEV
ncbi:TPA: DUF4258 domain-containing protein [Pseudomonas aeruginosa]|uniref:DUF4258 domain-containing protein n=1 Tax=Pseudomonas aeruginosa TaxID=287 RepID=UPI0003BAFA9E|nr:DUF4258 domain-containing protein [Pseudomonas aeruginosa]EJN1504481.1 DUF4258 domain-containing protein [Pseudomonas aeruginosa]EKY1868416.1 DUF4258 domain-containing protein [Pseudomonas aeruginosa]ELE9764439.1 DUF4258 domain-containing protein [Pseudomonas aeruginosa]ELE9770904.1 DUF4258 domain-containing protein [Pseudomonas aeruginosa]ELK4810429.1 DUF4258 domain-containing protein [Pseudomonas aeruginosa]